MSNSTPLWEILVPTIFNDGRPIKTRYHRIWDKKVQEITGGLTVQPPAKGKWTDPKQGDVYVERMIPVMIRCTKLQIEKIAEITMDYYEQLAVMYYKISEESYMLEASPEKIKDWEKKNKIGTHQT